MEKFIVMAIRKLKDIPTSNGRKYAGVNLQWSGLGEAIRQQFEMDKEEAREAMDDLVARQVIDIAPGPKGANGSGSIVLYLHGEAPERTNEKRTAAILQAMGLRK